MIKNRLSIVKIAIITLFLVFSSVFWVFVINLNLQVTSEYKTYQPIKATSNISRWQYHWGDSPLNNDGNYQWLDTATNEDGWIDFQFPGRPKNPEKFKVVWIRTTLHDIGISDASFKFRMPQQSVEVYLEDQLIYKYGESDTSKNVRTIGSTWHFVQLPSDYTGKTLFLRSSTPLPQYAGYLTQPAIGNMESLYLDILKTNHVYFIFGILFVFTGIAIIVAQLLGPSDWNHIKFLALAAIFIGTWYIFDTNIVQIFLDIPVFTTYMLNYSILLSPVWLLMYLEIELSQESSKARLIIRVLWILFAVLAASAFLLDMLNILSLLYYNIVFNYLIIISIVCVLLIYLNELHKGRKDQLLLMTGLLVFGVTGLFDSQRAVLSTSPHATLFKLSNVGMLFFLITLLISVVREFESLYSALKSTSKENETNYKSLFTNMTDGFIYSRLDRNSASEVVRCTILEANDAFIMETGKQKEELIGADLFTLYPDIKSKTLHCDVKLTHEADEAHHNMSVETAADQGFDSSDETATASECTYFTANAYSSDDVLMLGDKWYKVSAFCPKEGFLNIILSDISAMKKAEETIRHQAYTDNMTGFFSRTYFEEILSGMNSMMSVVKPLSIIATDIDGLKITNDTFGHDAGDNLIKKASQILSDVFGDDTPIARIGGDEFCVILPCTDFAAAQELAEQIVKKTEDSNNLNPVIPVSMSIGIASSYEDSNEDIYSIYRRADDDMYHYKLSQTSSEKSKVIDMLLTALSEKDYVSQGHVERISELCLLLAESMSLHENQKRDLVLLSKVHDLGKIGIPDDILNKPAKLSTKEYERMKLHVKIGYNIANRSRELVTIAPLILHHHEHWDGKGYPDSLKGDKIPLECRVLAIVDAFDAMTNDRPYHKGISVEEALLEIERCAGTQFDPNLTKEFVEIIRDYIPGDSEYSDMSKQIMTHNHKVCEQARAKGLHGSPDLSGAPI